MKEIDISNLNLFADGVLLPVEHGFKYFYIFESDITSGKHDVLYQIKDLINEASKN